MSSRGLFARRKSHARIEIPVVPCESPGDDAASGCSGQKANGIPDWEDPLGNSVSTGLPDVEPMPVPTRRQPRKSSSMKIRRNTSARLGASQQQRSMRQVSTSRLPAPSHVKPPPASATENYQRHNDRYYQDHQRYPEEQQYEDLHEDYEDHGYGPRHLEDMVIECNHDAVEQCSVGEITYDGSILYDHGHYHPEDDHYRQPRSRSAKQGRLSRAKSAECHHQQRHPSMMDQLHRGSSARYNVGTDENYDNQANGDLSLEEEERRLIELAMERSLQDSSNNSSRMSAMETSMPESMEFGSSRGGSLLSSSSHGPRHDQRPYERSGQGERQSFVWKREGKKWKKIPIASDGLQAIKERDDSSRRPSQLSREERLDLMEQQMFEEAMQQSLSAADLYGVGASRNSPSSANPGNHYHFHQSARSNQSRSYSGRSLLDSNKPYGYQDDVEDDDDDGLDEEEAMARLRELEEEKVRLQRVIRRRSLGKKCSRRSGTSETASMSLSDHSQDCYSSYGQRSPHHYDQDDYDQDDERYGGQHEYENDEYNVDDGRANYRDPYEQRSPLRKPSLLVHRTSSMESSDSKGCKTVWKKDRRGVWGRYSEDDLDPEDEESIMADVLKRSMHDQ